MNTSVTGDRVPPTEIRRAEMRQEVCEFAHALLQRGDCPLRVVQALIDGTLAFAGTIGEEAMRNHIALFDEVRFSLEFNQNRQKAETRDDKDNLPFF